MISPNATAKKLQEMKVKLEEKVKNIPPTFELSEETLVQSAVKVFTC